jgi:hypothetical protein
LGEFSVSLLASDGSKVIQAKGSSPAALLSSPQMAATHSLEVTGAILGDVKPQQVRV